MRIEPRSIHTCFHSKYVQHPLVQHSQLSIYLQLASNHSQMAELRQQLDMLNEEARLLTTENAKVEKHTKTTRCVTVAVLLMDELNTTIFEH